MIHTSRQLKALVRNQSHGDSTKAQTIIRSYMMERFLERRSLSPYRENFVSAIKNKPPAMQVCPQTALASSKNLPGI